MTLKLWKYGNMGAGKEIFRLFVEKKCKINVKFM